MACADGLWTDSTTWALVDSTSYLNEENSTESLLTTTYSNTRSSAFTPGAITIDGIAVKLCERIGTTGTMSIHLVLDTVFTEVAGTEVTIDVADLPSALESDVNGGWIFFKFSVPVLLVTATAYRIEAKTSSNTQVDLFCNGTVDNLSRCLRTTTTQDAVAGDDLIITGEKTGAGAETTRTVTMDETATTDYGSASTSLVTPALAICDGGILTWGTTAATNYLLRLSGNLIVYSGGTYNQGTTGTPIPRGSTGWLEFDCGADGDFGFTARNLSTVNIQFLSRTSAKDVSWCNLNTDEAINSTSLGVDADTGWLDNDRIVVASTTRTPTQTEVGTLNGNAGGSSLTVDGFAGAGGGLANAHGGGGTANVIAEVGLITRSGGVRAVTSTLVSYMNLKHTSIVDIDWAEFYYMGENATNKRGFEIETTTGSFSMQHCSLHDFEDGGIFINGNAVNNINISDNVCYNLNTVATTQAPGAGFMITATSGTTGIVVDSNLFLMMNCSGTGVTQNAGCSLLDISFTFTNNHVVASGNGAIKLAEGNASLGIFSGNNIHSTNNIAIQNTQTTFGGTLLNCKIWRNNQQGLYFAGNSQNVVNQLPVILDGCTLFGNGTSNIGENLCSITDLTIKDCSINGDASFSTTDGILTNAQYNFIKIINSTFGNVVAHTNDIASSSFNILQVYAFNSIFASANEFLLSVATNSNLTSFLKSHKHDQSSTTFKNVYGYGVITSETTTRHTASGYSWKLDPSSATFKLILPGPTSFDTFKRFVGSGQTVTITAYVQKDGSYNGNAPRLVMLGGIVGGIASDVTDSLTVGASTWEQLSVTGTATEDGFVEFYFDCDGTAGNVYVDDIDYTLV